MADNLSVLVEFSMFPTDLGESKSKYVSKIIEMIDKEGIPYKLTPMSTIFEVDSIEKATEILNKAYKVLEPYSNRVYSVAKFDIRKGKKDRLTKKVKSVEEKLGKEVSK